jgi:hypothetical protein
MAGESIAEKRDARQVFPAHDHATGFFTMPSNPPLTASGSRELKRPRPIPKVVRDAVNLMVFGRLDDPDCAPLNFIEAAKIAGIKPDVMRRWLDRAEIRALLRSERRAFREAICAGNEAALQRVRDKSANGMCVVASVRALEQIGDDPHSRGVAPESPHITINIVPPPASSPPMKVVERLPEPEPAERYDSNGFRIDDQGNRYFTDPTRPR